MKTYDIHAAIEMRSTGIWDDVKGFSIPVDFKTSIECAKDYNFMWGFHYPGEAIIQAANARNRGEKVTKEVWKKYQQGYRLYIQNCNDMADAGPYGYIN